MDYIQSVKSETAEILCECARRAAPKKILEIGTGKGRSGILLLSAAPEGCTLTTIEKNAETAKSARKNFVEAGLGARAEVITADAADVLEELNGLYDFIFLDGAKGQYIKYLPKLFELLPAGGILAADNVLFRGMVESAEEPPREYRSMVNNLRKFLAAIKTDKRLKTTIYNTGDGLSVSVKEEI